MEIAVISVKVKQEMSYLTLLLHELANDRLGLSHLSHGERANLFAK